MAQPTVEIMFETLVGEHVQNAFVNAQGDTIITTNKRVAIVPARVTVKKK